MQQRLQTLVAAALMTLGSISVSHAQTISTFDDLTLPSADTDFMRSQATAGDYSFQSGNVTFYGSQTSWGGYDFFNYTNYVDTANPSYTNDRAAITGKGYNNSANYGVAYIDQDYPANPLQSVIKGAKLQGAAIGGKVVGTYVTNTTYAYLYMKDNYTTNDSLTLVIRGYLAGAQSADSVVFNLAKYSATDTILVKNWQWVNLLPLGNVDSLSFQIFSSDDFTPYYFAFDNLTTLDGVCPAVTNLTATNVLQYNATISWTNTIAGIDSSYQIVVDQTAADPSINVTPVNLTALTYAASGLSPNILYYAHVRAACPDGGFSNWDTVSFRTQQPTSINDHYKNALNVTLSPNPAQDVINLNVAIPVSANIYNLEGKLLMNIANARQINVSGLSAGTYFVHVTGVDDDTKRAILRFTKN